MPMKNDIGVMAGLRGEGPSLQYVAEFGLKACQLCCWNKDLFTDKLADSIREESKTAKVKITSLWAGWPGPAVWDFVEGPYTLGLVPQQYRAERVKALKLAGDWAKRAGIPAIVTHLGFIPENAKDPEFAAVVEVVRDIAEHVKRLGVEFWFETGQETPVTMLRLIQQVGTGNLGINLDPANLILYGKANPVDALDVFGQHVKGLHAKDGLYPTDPMKLGHEVKVGEGKVRFPDFVRRLGEIGYKGAFIIEREIGGEQQRKDIAETVKYLKKLLAR
jgi:sugar phosphate isomerase/epimerase